MAWRDPPSLSLPTICPDNDWNALELLDGEGTPREGRLRHIPCHSSLFKGPGGEWPCAFWEPGYRWPSRSRPVRAPEVPAGQAAEPASASGERPFVVFAQPRLLIDRLGTPFAPPVTVGSTVSAETLRSDAPEIVEIDSAGALVGRRNGRTLVRSLADGSQVLEVEVQAATVPDNRPVLGEGARTC